MASAGTSFEGLNDMITAQELSQFLKFGYAKTLSFIKFSGVKYKRIGNSYRVTKQDLVAFLARKDPIVSLE
jgi:hypothetical protein